MLSTNEYGGGGPSFTPLPKSGLSPARDIFRASPLPVRRSTARATRDRANAVATPTRAPAKRRSPWRAGRRRGREFATCRADSRQLNRPGLSGA